eukprot:360433-Chlamydomonas_euryale.AAC.15
MGLCEARWASVRQDGPLWGKMGLCGVRWALCCKMGLCGARWASVEQDGKFHLQSPVLPPPPPLEAASDPNMRPSPPPIYPRCTTQQCSVVQAAGVVEISSVSVMLFV